jgi:hypothetical protein
MKNKAKNRKRGRGRAERYKKEDRNENKAAFITVGCC